MESAWIRTVGLKRYYRRGPQEVKAVDGVDLTIARGEFLGVVGASGSGKSTMLNLIAGLDTPTAGRVEVAGTSLGSLSGRELSAYRASRVGIVFQSFNLVPHLTAIRNVELALYFTGHSPRGRRRLAHEALENLGLDDRTDHRPADLSGGEQQRVAIARALVKSPEILFADEPTGNLDRENTSQIASLLSEANGRGVTVVMVTHNLDLARRCASRVIGMRYGRLAEETP